MKIHPEHIEHMRKAILANGKAPTLHSYTARGLTERRWMWDMLYLAGITPWVCEHVYEYANDMNIDTALRSILGGAS